MYKTGKETLSIMKLAKWYNDWVFSFFEKYVGGEILEVGAGIGNFSKNLAKRGKVTTVDIRRDYIKKLKKQTGQKILVGFGDIENDKYFFKNKKYNAIVCLNVLEHIKDDTKALENMFNLLKPSGYLILLVPAHKRLFSNFDKSLGHFRRYDKTLLAGKLRNVGFEIVEARYFNWLAAVGWYLFVRLSYAKKMPQEKVLIFDKFGKLFLWPEKIFKPPFGLSVFVVAYKK